MNNLSDHEQKRYYRQLIIPEIGLEGQSRLASAKVLVVGAGGLGSPVLMYLAAAGIGTIGIADSDKVEISNLQRQILYTSADIGISKTEAASMRMKSLNEGVIIYEYPVRITGDNIDGILNDFDIVVDCTDNFSSRYIINDASLRTGKPMVYGAVYQFFGQVSVFNYMNGPSYDVLFPDGKHAPDASPGNPPGVIGPLPGIVGSLEACEVIKIIVEKGEILSGQLLQIDALTLRYQMVKL